MKGNTRMNNILYTAQYRFDMSLLIPVIMFVVLLFMPKLQAKSFARAGKELPVRSKRTTKFFQMTGILLAGAFFILTISQNIDLYKTTVGAYRNGTYETVEGYVDSFIPMPKGGHSRESFEIDGVHFEYSENLIPSAYSKTKSNGGVIRGNGQYLKIGYIFHPNYGNVIVYIEEIDSLSIK